MNATSKEMCQTLHGIGPKTADKIIVYREKNGTLKKLSDLKLIKSLGTGFYAKFCRENSLD